MRRRVYKQSAVGGLLILVLLLSSCIKYETTIRVEDDGSGTISVLTAVNPDAFASLGEFGDLGDFGTEFEDAGQICADFNADINSSADLPANASVQPYNEDGFCGTRIESALEASTDLSDQLSNFLDSSPRLYKEGDNWFFETDFNGDQITGGAADFGDDIVADLFGDASFQITIDLPGRAVGGANNASQVGDGGVFRWDIDLLNPPARLFAQTEPGSGGGDGSSLSVDGEGGSTDDGGGLNPLLIGLVVVALLGAVAFFLWNKKKNEANDRPTDDLVQPGDPMTAATLSGQAVIAGGAVPGAVATMPVTDGPAITATPPSGEAVKETVVLSAADVAEAVAATNSPPTPVFDEQLQAWIVDDPARGRLRHDSATDTWNPI